MAGEPREVAVAFVRPKYEPKGRKFFDKASQREMMIVDADVPTWGGWLCWLHHDGNWVTERIATADDRARLAAAEEAFRELFRPEPTDALAEGIHELKARAETKRADGNLAAANECDNCVMVLERIARRTTTELHQEGAE